MPKDKYLKRKQMPLSNEQDKNSTKIETFYFSPYIKKTKASLSSSFIIFQSSQHMNYYSL